MDVVPEDKRDISGKMIDVGEVDSESDKTNIDYIEDEEQ